MGFGLDGCLLHDGDSGRRRRRLKLVPRGGGDGRRRLGAGDDDGAAEEEGAPLTLVLQNVRPVDYGDGASKKFVNLAWAGL